MANYIYKSIKGQNYTEQNVVHYKQTLTTASAGFSSTKVISGSLNTNYWNSVHVLFYTSGSSLLVEERGNIDLFDLPSHNFTINNYRHPQHVNKFHDIVSSSIFSIPSYYYGEKIKPGTFKLTDNSHPSGSVILVDDKHGNLYGVSASISQSSETDLSSSVNYAGNIFYDIGLAVIYTTGSYSHTPSTASISVDAQNMAHISGSHFFISNSVGTSIKFISTGSTETDTSTIKYFKSGSTTTVTAASASIKINDVFDGEHISASSVGQHITMSNDANLLSGRVPSNDGDNLSPISGAGGFNTTVGFGGGTSNILYNDIGTNYTLEFSSTNTITTTEYNVKILPHEFNYSLNPSLKCFPDASGLSMPEDSASFMSFAHEICAPYLSSSWQPYITTVALYDPRDLQEPVAIAKLPKALRVSDNIPMEINIKLDT